MLIRFFCPTDTTELGKVALEYADAFAKMDDFALRIVPNRVTQMQGVVTSWNRHQARFITPLQSDYVNVVCGEPDDWARLFTSGVRNVLLAGPPPFTRNQVLATEVALKYDVVIAPTVEISQRWHGALGIAPLVIPTDEAAVLRAALTP